MAIPDKPETRMVGISAQPESMQAKPDHENNVRNPKMDLNEKTVNPGDGTDFSEVNTFITRYQTSVIEQEVHRDPTGEHLLLVVKLNAAELDEISQEIVNLTFPEDITVYVYGRRPSIETA